MLFYESTSGKVTKGLIFGFRFRLPNGRVLPPPAWMKTRMAELHYGLKKAGFDSMNDPVVKGLFWEYFLDVSLSPPNGLRHQVEAETPVSELVQLIVDARRRSP